MNIYLNKNGQQIGPYTEQHVRDMLSQGHITANDWAWKEGMDDWKPVALLCGPPPTSTPPPPPVVQPSKATTQATVSQTSQFPPVVDSFSEGVRKKRKAYLLMCLVFAVMFFLTIAMSGGSEDAINVLCGLFAIPAIIFWWKCFKCPSCKKYMHILGGGGFPFKAPKSCKKCGAGAA